MILYRSYMGKLFSYFNPLAHIGKRKYSILLPLLISVLIPVLSELYAYGIAQDPNSVGAYIIFLNVATIIYFSFRDGQMGYKMRDAPSRTRYGSPRVQREGGTAFS